MENSIIITLCVGLLGLIYIFNYFYTKGFNLTLDIVIFMLLIAGLIFHRTPIQYIRAFSDSTKSASGILLQFPFYAGIMGMMIGQIVKDFHLEELFRISLLAFQTKRLSRSLLF